ncbi:FG-GAP repeat domain-containing protein [Streptomyces sp. NPDC001070]
MTRRALVRGPVAAIAAFAVAAGPGPLIAPAAADTAQEAVIPPVTAPRVHTDTFSAAGDTGYVFRAEGAEADVWRSYDGRIVRDLGALDFTPHAVRFPDGREWLAVAIAAGAYRTYDIAADTWTSHALPSGQGWLDSFGTDDGLLTVSYANVRNEAGQLTGHSLHLLTGEGDAAADRTVSGWPEGAFVTSTARRGDGRGLVLSYKLGDDRYLGLVDFASGALVWSKSWGKSLPPSQVVLDGGRFGWYAENAVHLLPRTDPSAAEATVTLPTSPSGGLVAYRVALSGDSVLAWYQAGNTPGGAMYPLVAVPVGGGAATTLLPDASNVIPAAGGGALAIGGTGYDDWAAHRVTPDGAGGFRTEPVQRIGNTPPQRYGLALGRGKLRFAEGVEGAEGNLTGLRYARDMGTSAAPGAGEALDSGRSMTGVASCAAGTAAGCAEFFAAGQDVAFVRVGDNGKDSVVVDASPDITSRAVALDSSGGRIVDADDDYAVYNSGSDGRQYVLDIRSGFEKVKLTRTIRAASVWGTTLWSAGGAAGEVTAYDLTTGKTTGTLATAAPCVVNELQALGRWLYWSCGTHGAAGVYDRTTKKNITVPPGEALLGDGFVVRHAGDELVLTDVHTGTATTRTLAALPAGPLPSDRRVTWTVDKYRGHIAYTDAAAATHVLAAGVPASALGILSSSAGNVFQPRESVPWTAAWTFSGPVSSWSVEFRNKATGKLYTTAKGGAVRSAIQVTWNGRDAAKALVPSGIYTWTLRAVPANGQGATLATSGTISVTKGNEIFHGFGPNGVPDVFTLTSDNRLLQRPGTTSGAFGPVTDVGVPRWPSGTGFVPFGDLKKNDCNDMIVRTAAGQLRLYGGDCESDAFMPNGSYTSLGTGFQQYNVMTSPGDMTGDGIPDLIARKSSTSDVYLYKGTSSGKLSARVRLASKWTGYKKVVGAGDLNGDGIGDLLVQDKANVLWRYNGDGKGHLKPRVKLASGWGASYNAVLGIGDLTCDGKADLIARDTAGNLYRYNGNGKGAFGSRTKIATGWRSLKGVL